MLTFMSAYMYGWAEGGEDEWRGVSEWMGQDLQPP